MEKGNPRVFVYGSLKKGHSNSYLLEGYNFLGRAYIEGPYRMMSLGYFPGVTDGHEETSRIYGEVWVVDEQGLGALDLLEGHPTFYERVKVTTSLPDIGKAWVYLYRGQHKSTHDVPDGIWYPDEEERKEWGFGEENAA